jgi:hypothetical protein
VCLLAYMPMSFRRSDDVGKLLTFDPENALAKSSLEPSSHAMRFRKLICTCTEDVGYGVWICDRKNTMLSQLDSQ